jgi:hypothetical protein
VAVDALAVFASFRLAGGRHRSPDPTDPGELPQALSEPRRTPIDGWRRLKLIKGAGNGSTTPRGASGSRILQSTGLQHIRASDHDGEKPASAICGCILRLSMTSRCGN